jgi:hypothetical protein
MSDEQANDCRRDPIVQPFVDLWASYVSQTAENPEEFSGNFESFADPRAWHQQWLDAVSKSIDAYMRTPVFLQMLKQNLDAMIQARLRAVAADRPATDESGQATGKQSQEHPQEFVQDRMQELSQRVETAEQQIVDRLQEIERRFTAIESALHSRGTDRPGDNDTPANASS